MTFRLPKKLKPNETATITNINANFAAVETEINNLPVDGQLNTGQWVTNAHLIDGSIKTSKLARVKTSTLTDSDYWLASSNAIRAYYLTKT
jgi:hypothetical protein